MLEEKRVEVNSLGEFGLIEKLTSNFKSIHPNTIKAVGDDAAVIDRGSYYELVSTDFLVEGIHFDLSYTPLKHLGYKVVVVNVSDIAAMNGIPKQITVSVALSNRFSIQAIEEVYEGIRMACEQYGVDLIGGDTTSSQSGLIISVTVLGEVAKDKVAYRNGAQVGDVIAVTGDLGAAYIGLQLLEREKEVYISNPEMQPEIPEDQEYAVKRILKPEARMDIIHEFNALDFKPSAMMDISDGLASELFHISTQSGVGVEVWDENIFIENTVYEQALEFGIDPLTCALNGGEDYELLFTCSEKEFKKLKNVRDIISIGKITEKGHKLVTKKGNVIDLEAQGWVSF